LVEEKKKSRTNPINFPHVFPHHFPTDFPMKNHIHGWFEVAGGRPSSANLSRRHYHLRSPGAWRLRLGVPLAQGAAVVMGKPWENPKTMGK